MADGTAEVAKAIAGLTTALIEMFTRLSVELIRRQAERLREAAQRGEQAARKERARLARHRAADAAIWQRTENPDWWARAQAEDITRAWRAASMWHQVDPEAAGARQAMAERLQARGVNVAQDVSADPSDVRWLQTALNLAQAERAERIAFRDDLDTDAELADELMWQPDELPRQPPAKATPMTPQPDPAAQQQTQPTTAQQPVPNTDAAKAKASRGQAEIPSEVLWAADEKPRPPQEASSLNGRHPNPEAATVTNTPAASLVTAASPTADAASQAQERQAAAEQMAVATQPDQPRRLPPQQMTRMADIVTAAWPDEPDRAQRVLSDGAWPALASSMHRLDSQGKDVARLLSRLDATTTESSVPAVTTDWALRAAAAGPAAQRRMVAGRQAHQDRLTTARQQQQQSTQPVAAIAPDDNSGRPQTAQDVDGAEAARLLAAAFPQSTREALNRQRPGVTVTDPRPGTVRDRSARRDKEAAPAER